MNTILSVFIFLKSALDKILEKMFLKLLILISLIFFSLSNVILLDSNFKI